MVPLKTNKLSFLLILFFIPLFGKIPISISNPEILTLVSKFPHQGTLNASEDGYIYLEVSPNYIEKVFPLIAEEGMTPPPSQVGAHISVFRPVFDKTTFHDLPEVGNTYSFDCVDLHTVEPDTNGNDWERVWFITVISPELEDLRAKYGLSRKLNEDYDFHITVAIQTRS